MHRTFSACLLFLLLGCGPARRASTPTSAPSAEFLLATQDSTFWIRSGPTGIRARGAPLTLANFGGRFYEVFLADDDHSFPDALLIGQRVYRRDLLSGDSALVFEDSVVPRIAREYARAHPSERPLQPDDEGAENPATQATAELEVLGVYGPYLSYEYHVDIARAGGNQWHATRRGVLDLRSGGAADLRDLFPDSTASQLGQRGRLEFRALADSVRGAARRTDEAGRRAALSLSKLHFDERSFVLTTADSVPAVEFAIPERGVYAAEDLLALPALPLDLRTTAHWWSEVRPRLPVSEDDIDRWSRLRATGYDVLARYDSAAELARLVLRDSTRHEWPVTTVAAPVLHIFWLDRPAVDTAQRRALSRAFDEASLYDDAARTVRDTRRRHPPPLFFASLRPSRPAT
jgi:hypothetical protein